VLVTARSYLLAGFTAASIVATIPFAPRSTVHMPDIHAADVQLAAAESKIAATVRTLRAVEARAVASTVDGATTTVLPDLVRRSTAATTIDQPAPTASALAPSAALVPSVSGVAPTATTHASTAAPAVTVPNSILRPVAGDSLALGFDLAGTPAAFMNSLSFVADATIASLTGGTAENLPAGFGVAQRLNLITADLNGLTDAINKLTGFLQSGAGDSGAGTQTGVTTGSVAASNSGSATAAATGAPDLGALAPLIGDVAILGVDMTASPFAMTQTVTRAIAAASTDLGAGDMQAAQTAFNKILQTGLAATQARIADDKNNIGAALARLMGKPSTTTSQVGTANSVTGATNVVATTKTTSTPAVQSHPTSMGPGPVVTKPTSSTPAAVHKSTTTNTATAAPSTVSTQGSSHTPGTTATTTRQGSDTAGATKPSTPSPTKAGGSGSANANANATAKHSDPAKSHDGGAKHGKH
jgi:hypothetical protein